MRRSLSRFWIALAILPFLAGAALASGPVLFVCRGDAGAHHACGCPAAEPPGPQPEPAAATLSAACCCDVSQVNSPATPVVAEPRAAERVHQAVLLPAAAMALTASPLDAQASDPARLAPPPPAIPILLAKQSLLA
jgi:hypothetical protein